MQTSKGGNINNLIYGYDKTSFYESLQDVQPNDPDGWARQNEQFH